ncbi:MAG TPA: RHS repeat-associated core domain-containing protein [Candidatus Polarisedimenticolia bacterium]|nr:RHS repeat-associated core domain-containing protein [Candidatus Polarisedimenticolia bacterium]
MRKLSVNYPGPFVPLLLLSLATLLMPSNVRAQGASGEHGQILVFPPVAGRTAAPLGNGPEPTVPSDTQGRGVAFGEPYRVWTVWYINVSDCTSLGTGTITASQGPNYGVVMTTQGSLPLPPGYPCAGVSLPETTAYYTWNIRPTTTVIDFFHLHFEATDGAAADTDWQTSLIGKDLGSPNQCYAPEGTQDTRPGGPSCGDPIDIGSGNVFEKITDYETAGQNKLSFIRYYNSLGVPNTYASTLGANWRSNYDRYVNVLPGGIVVVERPDGQLLNFTKKAAAFIADADVDYVLLNKGATWTMTDHDDTVETYTTLSATEVMLDSIKLRNGYTQTLKYNASHQLESVTDTYGRQLLFTYLPSASLNMVTTPDGLVLTYNYNSIPGGVDNQLISVSYSTTPATSQQYQYAVSTLPFALTGIVDENGNTFASWTYDQFSRGLTSQHGNGADLTTVSYNDSDGSRTVTNALGVTDTYSFVIRQAEPKVSKISRAATSTTAAAMRFFAYDTNGYTASQTDWNGNKTSYVNNAHGEPTTITEPTRVTTISYDPTFVHLPHQIITPGLTTTFKYDASGNMLTRTLLDTTNTTVPYVTKGETRVWTYTWARSLLSSVKTPRTDVKGLTQFAYNAGGALMEITNALGQKTRITQNTGGGLPETIVDPNGVTTTLTYDGRLRLSTSTVKTSAGRLTTTFGHDAAGNLTSVELPDGSTLTNGYDTAHRLISVKDLFGQTVAYTLDALGDQTLTNVSNSANTATLTHSGVFDALARVLKDIGGMGQTTVYTYDKNGNALAITDPLTNKTTQGFDELNRLDKITDPVPGGITNITFDAHDRPLTVTAPNGAMTLYVYDGFGDAIQISSPDTGITVNHFDPDGELTQSTNAAKAVADYTYDARDRVLTTTYPNDTTENVAYTYDQTGHGFGIGRLTSLTDAAGSLSRSYDERGNILTETRTETSATLKTAYSYDAASRIASITYPSKWLVSYTRDIMGRITAVNATKPGGKATAVVSSVTYEPFGPITGTTFGNGVADARTFDLDYRMLTLTDKGTASVQNLTYGYDADNNVKTITDAVTSANSQTLGYDPLNRLNSASGGYGNLAYTYDKSGNRLTEKRGIVTTNYGYTANTNILDTLTIGTATTETFGYSAAGNINSFNPGIMGAGSNPITSLTYNQANRLAKVLAGTSQVAGYSYNAFGNRLVKVTGTTTLYQHDHAGNLLEEASGTGTAQVDYIYVGGMPIATIAPAAGKLYFIHADRLGTPQLTTDGTQAIAWQTTYQPFGTTGTVSGLITQNLRLPGQQFDAETGFNHNGFRDYMPNLGRYLETDPIGLGGGLNTYSYAGGNPFVALDPLGLASQHSEQSCARFGFPDCAPLLPSSVPATSTEKIYGQALGSLGSFTMMVGGLVEAPVVVAGGACLAIGSLVVDPSPENLGDKLNDLAAKLALAPFELEESTNAFLEPVLSYSFGALGGYLFPQRSIPTFPISPEETYPPTLAPIF